MTAAERGAPHPGRLHLAAAIARDELVIQGDRSTLLRLRGIATPTRCSVRSLEERGLEPLKWLEFDFAGQRRPSSGFGVAAAHRGAGARVVGTPNFDGLARFLSFTVEPNDDSEINERGWHVHLTLDADAGLWTDGGAWTALSSIMLCGPNQTPC